MGTGKTYSTDYLVDSNGNTGVAGQILVTTATGVNWQDAENTGDNQTQGSLFDSKVVLIDTPNGGLKPYRVITDEYGEWIQVGRFAANAMTTIQGTWSSVSGLSTGITQSETTSFSADFGDSFPDEVRVMGATDFNNWRNTRTIDWVYKVPKGRKWKYFFSGGATNGMTPVPLAGTPSPSSRYGWGVNGAYDGFGRWTNVDLSGIGMSDGNVTNPSAAYTTATSNAFNWDGFDDAKLTVNAFGIYSGQDQNTTSFVGSDDPTDAFFDTWPTETNNGTGGTEFSSAVWVLIKIPGGASGGGGDDVYWSENGNDIYNDNTGNVGIGTTLPSATLDVHAPSTTAPSLTMGAAAGQIFKNEDSELAFGLMNASPYNVWMQSRFNGDVARPFLINPLGGNIGIGTLSPSAKLEVAFDGSHTSGDISYTQANIDVYNPLQADTDEKGSIITFTDNYFDGTNYVKTTRAAIKGGTDTAGNTADGFLAFYTDSGGANSATERMRIKSNGQVNISQKPNSGLTYDVLINLGTSPDGLIGYQTQSQLAANLAANSSSNWVKSGNDIYNTNSANVGIGETSPKAVLNIKGVSGTPAAPTAGVSPGIFRVESSNAGVGLDIGQQPLAPYSMWMQVGNTSNSTGDSYPLLLNPVGSNVGIGTLSPSAEGNLSLGAKSTTEGGHLILEKGTSKTEATHIDNAGDTFRIMGGTNASSGAVDFSINHLNQKAYFPGYVGFGVSGPSYPIHAQSSNGSWMAYLYNTSSTGIGAHIETNASGTEPALRVSSIFGGSNNAGLQVLSNGNSYFGRNITTPTQDLSTAATPTNFGVYSSEIRLIDTPNGGLKQCRVITDNYGEWILVGRFAANAMTTVQSTWSSESGLDTSTSQSTTTKFSADFGDSYPTEVRIMGATDFGKWRDTRTVDFVYGVPEGTPWKYFFSGGAVNGMTSVGPNHSGNNKFGWSINGSYDGFGRWVNPLQTSVGMSDGNPTNPSAAYTTATTNAFNWDTNDDAKISVSASRTFSGQDSYTTAAFGNDDGIQGFFDGYPSEYLNMTGGATFSSSAWVLIKLPTAISSGSGGGVGNQWTGGPANIHSTNTAYAGIGTSNPRTKLEIYRPAGQSSYPQLTISTGEANSRDWAVGTDVMAAGDLCILQGASVGAAPQSTSANVRMRFTDTTGSKIMFKYDNTTELGTYASTDYGGSVKRIRMRQGGEIHFGDTAVSSPLGITEGTWDNFTDQDYMSIYARSKLDVYTANVLMFSVDTPNSYFTTNLGINNTSPRNKLTVFTDGTANEEIALRLVNPVGFGPTGGGGAGSGASIIFAQDRSVGENYTMAKIRSTQGITGTSGYGNLVFSTSQASTMSDQMTILSSGRVGIGNNNSAPIYPLDVHDAITSGVIIRAKGIGAMILIESNTAGEAYLYQKPNQTGDQEARFMMTANSTYGWAWSDDGSGTPASRVKYMKLDQNPGTLTVKGDVVAYGTPSDISLKENIKPIDSALDKVMKLQGVTFDWKKTDSILELKEDIGFIAQDVQKVVPELIRENSNGLLSMRHQGVAPILLEAIKELKAEIDLLKSKPCTCNKCNCNI